VKFYDFEFEQFTLQRDIIKELILDEIIISNSRMARAENKILRDENEQGILEKIYKKSKNEAYVDSKEEEKLSTNISQKSNRSKESGNSEKKTGFEVGVKSESTTDNSPVKTRGKFEENKDKLP
jgi:hypothetical protein